MGIRNVSLPPIVDMNRERAAVRILVLFRCPEAGIVDRTEAHVRHALHDHLQKAAVGKLNAVECPSVQRLQNVLENFARQG